MPVTSSGEPEGATDPSNPAPVRHRPLLGGTLLAIGVVLTALNLRAAVTSVSSMLGDIRDSLGASATWVSLLSSVPTLCFAAAGFLVPWFGRRFGMARAIGFGLALIAAGQLLRVLDGPVVVLAGTLVACGGIAIGNVLIPVVVKESFAARVGLMTGVYTAALQASGSLGSSLTPQLDAFVGSWRFALASWVLLALLALGVWALGARHGAAVVTEASEPAPVSRSLLRSPLAWIVTAFFALQSLAAYVLLGWMPQVWVTSGVDRGTAGLLLGLVSIIAVPVSLVAPALAARRPSQSGWIAGLTLVFLAGMTGMMLAPASLPVLWAILLGIGSSVFAMLLAVLPLRTRNSADTARLSAMAQGIGYLSASAGPFLFGMLHEATGDWTASFVLVLVVLTVQLVVGWFAGRPRYV
ncbi:CP family cyanate transporter-like MFS transporter [Tamaricihabitans halophyticus]|uniref:CP family cyanate transporter-like MFS transporter n=1 Tax=Tamaricihabitans halophyticus TaxID=1262583 RepID=A0A4R2R4G3_9PSEU|nr:CP family cyanate transporter-like MFS transporter [Tamaricihabitans halophyticus]